ncbi:hypothetical protein RclHR1_26510002 [Rhizophagus clarus]|uniref:Uncharacterized protein n=2 Tax=Rhizophagus clarus TaxID=94130 RepID=A0A2Z6RGD6_9GLOM|nr:hypothetical protein RclHR1_26510002 [Rhizophagus clarus]
MCVILNDIMNIQKSNYHHTIILYPGIEKYEILQEVMTPMINELNDLVINGLKDSTGKIWKIKPYFSSDWKFLSIILGFNASNANYFCLWCLCTKKDIGNKNKVYTIEKNMNQLDPAFFNHHSSEKPPPGHIKPPLLKIIPLDYYIADELHIMLRIWDQLWLLVLQELKMQNRFNDSIRAVIITEMRRISVTFQFWQDQET